ncbi:MAG: glycosyltransferase family 1 protein [Dehalococcoidia bacterium]
MTALQRALVVGPYPGSRWRSISNYTDGLLSMSGLDGVELRAERAWWWLPPGVDRVMDARRGRMPLSPLAVTGAQLVHMTDQGLAHHVSTFAGLPTIVTCHDLMPFVVPSYYRGARWGMLRKFALRASLRGMGRATRVVAVSERTARDITALTGISPGRISVVGVPSPGSFRPVQDADEVLARRGIVLPPGPRILSVGSAAAYKNLGLLLRAIARPELAGAALVRVGEPLTRRHHEFAQRLGVAGRVVELGRIDDEALVAVYNACTVLAQPSIYEGFGMPVMEAMACGLPVVTSDGGALPGTAGDAAVVVPLQPRQGAASRWAREIANVLGDADERCLMRERGLSRAALFRPEAIARQLLAVYRGAIAEFEARG